MRWLFFPALLLIAPAAHAAETITYSYDPLGRLVASSISGGPKSGVGTTYTYDPAGNRSRVKVTGAGGATAPCSFGISDDGVDARSGSPLEFVVARTGTCSGDVSLSYATQDGSASAPTHYSATNGSIVFSTADAAKTILVPTVATHDPSPLYMSITISLLSGTASITRNQGTGVLIPD